MRSAVRFRLSPPKQKVIPKGMAFCFGENEGREKCCGSTGTEAAQPPEYPAYLQEITALSISQTIILNRKPHYQSARVLHFRIPHEKRFKLILWYPIFYCNCFCFHFCSHLISTYKYLRASILLGSMSKTKFAYFLAFFASLLHF